MLYLPPPPAPAEQEMGFCREPGEPCHSLPPYYLERNKVAEGSDFEKDPEFQNVPGGQIPNYSLIALEFNLLLFLL